jgi:hypothetical protein
MNRSDFLKRSSSSGTGIACHSVCYLGTVHGFDTFGDLAIVNHAYEQSVQWLSTL